MSTKLRRISVWTIAIAVVVGLGLWFCPPSSKMVVASAFAPADVREIRRVVRQQCWLELRKTVAAHNLKRLWHYALPLALSRVESIAGYPGPPGGARVECRGPPGSDTECAFMVFNGDNGWNCQSIDFHDASLLRQIRQMGKESYGSGH